MQLASPFFLILLIAVPLLIIASRWLHKRTITPVVRFSDFNHGFAASVQQMRQTLSIRALAYTESLEMRRPCTSHCHPRPSTTLSKP